MSADPPNAPRGSHRGTLAYLTRNSVRTMRRATRPYSRSPRPNSGTGVRHGRPSPTPSPGRETLRLQPNSGAPLDDNSLVVEWRVLLAHAVEHSHRSGFDMFQKFCSGDDRGGVVARSDYSVGMNERQSLRLLAIIHSREQGSCQAFRLVHRVPSGKSSRSRPYRPPAQGPGQASRLQGR